MQENALKNAFHFIKPKYIVSIALFKPGDMGIPHWNPNKMSNILQTTFPSAFSWKKMV